MITADISPMGTSGLNAFKKSTGFDILEKEDCYFVFTKLKTGKHPDDSFYEFFYESPYAQSMSEEIKELIEENEKISEELKKYKTFYNGFHGKL